MELQNFKTHPIYNLYASDKNGNIINIKKVNLLKTERGDGKYNFVSVKSQNNKKQKNIACHRFTYECFNDIITPGLVIDHVDNNIKNNKLDNLQMITQQENCKKSAKNRDYSFARYNNQHIHFVRSTCIETGIIDYHHSLHNIQRDLGINAGIVKMVCEKINK